MEISRKPLRIIAALLNSPISYNLLLFTLPLPLLYSYATFVNIYNNVLVSMKKVYSLFNKIDNFLS